MSNIYEIKNRLLVPNWRDFKRTALIGELGFNNIPRDTKTDNSAIKFDWKNNKTIGIAADLISNSFVSNELQSKELAAAISFIEGNQQEASKSLLSLIEKIKIEVNPNSENINTILEKNISNIDEFNSITNVDLFNKIIAKTKNLTKSYSENAIYWMELARLYTIKNQLDKAEKCVAIALNLAPDNRFILRSSTRFYIHSCQEEKAIYYLRKSQTTKTDPWLISAHIASSKLIGRYSPFIKNGIAIINGKNFSNFDLTELASSLGTLEFESGSFKKSKPFLDLSVIQPNDNSLAQFEWISKKDIRFIFRPKLFETVKNPFEASAYENFQKGEFVQAFHSCINWYLDFPYSKRPLMFGSYIAALIEDHNASIILSSVGLRFDRKDINFINNIIYSLCLKNDLEEVEKYLKVLDRDLLNSLEDEEKIMIQATLGLYSLRLKNIDEGMKLYELALENAKKINSAYYYNLALINYTRELFLLHHPRFKDIYELFKSIKSTDIDIKYQKEILSQTVLKIQLK